MALLNFLDLKEVLETGTHKEGEWEYDSFERLVKIYNSKKPSSRDLAVIIRQTLLNEWGANRNWNDSPSLEVLKSKFEANFPFQEHGLRKSEINDTFKLTTSLWKPSWLKNSEEGVDREVSELKDKSIKFSGSYSKKADPFLAGPHFGYEEYKSPLHKRSVRAALNMPKGSSLLVSLPTGEGKSTIFHLIYELGFQNKSQKDRDCITLVICPTVALSLDHELTVQHLFRNQKKVAYVGGDTTRNEEIIQSLKKAEKGIYFFSPEALISNKKLSSTLISLAKGGLIRSLIIDEAHLVDSWGSSFRWDYIALGGFQQQLFDHCPQGQEFRTLGLSATWCESSVKVFD